MEKKASPLKNGKSGEDSSSAYVVAQNIAQAISAKSATGYATDHGLLETEVVKIRDALQDAMLHTHIRDLALDGHEPYSGMPFKLKRLKSAASLRSKRGSRAEDIVFMAPPVRTPAFNPGQALLTVALTLRRKAWAPCALVTGFEAA